MSNGMIFINAKMILPVVKLCTFSSPDPKISIRISENAATLHPHIPRMNFPVRSRSWGKTE